MGRAQSRVTQKMNSMKSGDTYFHKFLVTKDRNPQMRHVQNAATRTFEKGTYTTRSTVKNGVSGVLVTYNGTKASPKLSSIASSVTRNTKDDTFTIEKGLKPQSQIGRKTSSWSAKINRTLNLLKVGESFCVPRRKSKSYSCDYQRLYLPAKTQLGSKNFTINGVQENNVESLRCFRLK